MDLSALKRNPDQKVYQDINVRYNDYRAMNLFLCLNMPARPQE